MAYIFTWDNKNHIPYKHYFNGGELKVAKEKIFKTPLNVHEKLPQLIQNPIKCNIFSS